MTQKILCVNGKICLWMQQGQTVRRGEKQVPTDTAVFYCVLSPGWLEQHILLKERIRHFTGIPLILNEMSCIAVKHIELTSDEIVNFH